MSRARKLADLLDASGDVKNDAMDNVALSDLDVTATAAEVNILDGVTATTAELNTLDGVTATTAELNIMDGVTATTSELNTLDGVTATTAELNTLDGVTATTSELNTLDGVTATASEINTLDGITATTAELNLLDGVTATTAELNYVDGVTSNIQTQINNISTDVVSDTTPQLGGNLDTNGNNVNFGDTDTAQFGAGNDLQIYHNGSNSVVTETGTGKLYVGGSTVQLTNGAVTATYAKFNSGGSSELYYNNAKKFETTSTGVSVTGTITTDGLDYRTGTNQTLIVGNSGSYAGGEYGRVMFKEGNSELAKMQWNGTGNVFEVTNQVNGPLVLKTNNTERLKINGDGTWGKAPRGTVIQVLSDHEFGVQSYNGTGESTILSQAITPKFSNSKILILASTNINSLHGYRYAYGKLYRGSTGIFIGDASGSRARVSMGSAGNSDGYDRYVLHNQHISFLDSPNTTSQVTYQIRMGNSYYNTTVYNNRPSEDSNAGWHQRGASSLIVMEIAQ